MFEVEVSEFSIILFQIFLMMKNAFDFLKQLSENNNRSWFAQHKERHQRIVETQKEFFSKIFDQLQNEDYLEKFHLFRIYKDVRFSKDKTPFKTNFGVHFVRKKPMFRGGYYVHLEPDKSFVGGGFWSPSPEDLLRIRREFEFDDCQIHSIEAEPLFREYFGEIQGQDGVKTAPKGFDKNHSNIRLIKKRQFVVKRNFTDEQVYSSDFQCEVLKTFRAMRPFFDYMTEVLTTDANGVSLF